jgi:hypothetical protein
MRPLTRMPTDSKDGIQFNSIRLSDDRLDSSPFLFQLEFSAALMQLFKSSARAQDDDLREVASGSVRDPLVREIERALRVEVVLFSGQQALIFSDDQPHYTPIPPLQLIVKDVGPGNVATLLLQRNFPLSSSHMGSRFRLAIFCQPPAAPGVSTGVPPLIVFSEAFRVLAKMNVRGAKTKMIHWPRFQQLEADRARALAQIIGAGFLLRSQLNGRLQESVTVPASVSALSPDEAVASILGLPPTQAVASANALLLAAGVAGADTSGLPTSGSVPPWIAGAAPLITASAGGGGSDAEDGVVAGGSVGSSGAAGKAGGRQAAPRAKGGRGRAGAGRRKSRAASSDESDEEYAEEYEDRPPAAGHGAGSRGGYGGGLRDGGGGDADSEDIILEEGTTTSDGEQFYYDGYRPGGAAGGSASRRGAGGEAPSPVAPPTHGRSTRAATRGSGLALSRGLGLPLTGDSAGASTSALSTYGGAGAAFPVAAGGGSLAAAGGAGASGSGYAASGGEAAGRGAAGNGGGVAESSSDASAYEYDLPASLRGSAAKRRRTGSAGEAVGTAIALPPPSRGRRKGMGSVGSATPATDSTAQPSPAEGGTAALGADDVPGRGYEALGRHLSEGEEAAAGRGVGSGGPGMPEGAEGSPAGAACGGQSMHLGEEEGGGAPGSGGRPGGRRRPVPAGASARGSRAAAQGGSGAKGRGGRNGAAGAASQLAQGHGPDAPAAAYGGPSGASVDVGEGRFPAAQRVPGGMEITAALLPADRLPSSGSARQTSESGSIASSQHGHGGMWPGMAAGGVGGGGVVRGVSGASQGGPALHGSPFSSYFGRPTASGAAPLAPFGTPMLLGAGEGGAGSGLSAQSSGAPGMGLHTGGAGVSGPAAVSPAGVVPPSSRFPGVAAGTVMQPTLPGTDFYASGAGLGGPTGNGSNGMPGGGLQVPPSAGNFMRQPSQTRLSPTGLHLGTHGGEGDGGRSLASPPPQLGGGSQVSSTFLPAFDGLSQPQGRLPLPIPGVVTPQAAGAVPSGGSGALGGGGSRALAPGSTIFETMQAMGKEEADSSMGGPAAGTAPAPAPAPPLGGGGTQVAGTPATLPAAPVLVGTAPTSGASGHVSPSSVPRPQAVVGDVLDSLTAMPSPPRV